jgi:hypothetical protein
MTFWQYKPNLICYVRRALCGFLMHFVTLLLSTKDMVTKPTNLSAGRPVIRMDTKDLETDCLQRRAILVQQKTNDVYSS